MSCIPGISFVLHCIAMDVIWGPVIPARFGGFGFMGVWNGVVEMV